jgi:hypothetical protein
MTDFVSLKVGLKIFKERLSLPNEKSVGESASSDHVGGTDYPEPLT